MDYEIELSVTARLRIMQIITEKCKGQGKSRDFGIAADLYEKIEITDEEREKKYQFKDRDGVERVNATAIREAPIERFKLNFRELDKLEKLLDDYSEISPPERKLWYNWVMTQLEVARKPPEDDEATKTRRLEDFRKNSSTRLSPAGSE